MKQPNIVFLILAFLTAFLIILIGIAVGERSILGIIGSIVGIVAMMGIGFTYKKKLREKE
ncbi:DUF5325 family protein [Bacillus sp. DJP31]|uniref:DUF5325 family protein n=1 Tax=Bacillus sp. DJP31 TaxID=3409789 RepID=UPI003BB584E8